MSSTRSRREVLGLVGAIVLAGCASGGADTPGGSGTDTATATATSTDGGMTPTDDGTTPSRQDLVDRLPETSPLSGTLTDLVAAEDWAQFAADRELDFRAQSNDVRVQVELESDGSLPDGYRVEVESTTGQYVEAYVQVRDLVPLAMEPAVRKIQRPPTSRTDSGSL